MKILIVSDTLISRAGGVAYFSKRLAFYLKKRGHDVLVLVPAKNTKLGFFVHQGVKVFGVSSIPILVYEGFRISPAFLFNHQIKKVIAGFKPDIIHIQGHFLICQTAIKIAKEFKIPIVATNHFLPNNFLHYLYLGKKEGEIVEKLLWHGFKKVYNNIDYITTPTKTAVAILKSIGFNKKVIPISCGIDLKRFNPQNNGNYLRKKYHLPNKSVLLFVGRLDKEKNIDLIISAASLALQKTDFILVIAGRGKEKNNLIKLAQKINIQKNIYFTGFVSDADLPYLYAMADCFVIAGEAELQSIVTLEALASGLPVLGLNCLALPELVHHNKNGFLFELGNEIQLAENIVEIFQNHHLRQQFSKASLKIIRNHDIQDTITNYEKLYHSIITKYIK
ncbi:MAG: glycosyltransferase [Patescibacteria group bacterium]